MTVPAVYAMPLCPGTGCPIRYLCAYYEEDPVEGREMLPQIPGQFSRGPLMSLQFTCSYFRSKGGLYDQEIEYIDGDGDGDGDDGSAAPLTGYRAGESE